ncbi:MAG: 50S ribosomal protein L21 [Eubacteriales bacterium]|nr:50S ribosomal protein L21 [Eubacteriales bacterium]
MYAVIETGGKQYRVQEGDRIVVEKLGKEAGETVEFDKVLVHGEGADIKVGTPCIEGMKVFGTVVETGKGQKVIIYKYKSKKDYRKKQGHRQPYTMVEITGLTGEKPAVKKEETVKNEAPVVPSFKSMKKDELIAFAKDNNIEIAEKATKPVIIEVIEAAIKN